MDNRTTKNYAAHGGSEWVIGGKLTFLPGASVEGIERLLDITPGEEFQLPYVPDSTAGTVAALRDDFNRFLQSLRDAGLMAQAPDSETGDA